MTDMIVSFDSKALDEWWNSSALYRRRVKVEKKLRAELKSLAARYGLEIAADYVENYGSVSAYIVIRTIHNGRGAAWKARTEEDDEIHQMNALCYQAEREAYREMQEKRYAKATESPK